MGFGDGMEGMQPGAVNEPASATWYRDAKPAYRLAFGVGLLVFAGSFLAGLGEAIRVLGAPPLAVDATVLGRTLVAQGDYSRAFGEFRLAGTIDPVGYLLDFAPYSPNTACPPSGIAGDFASRMPCMRDCTAACTLSWVWM